MPWTTLTVPILIKNVYSQVSVADEINLGKEQLSTLAWRLHNDLSNDVYDGDIEKVIENCRVICDLKSLMLKIY